MKILNAMLLIISLLGFLNSCSQSEPSSLAEANQAYFQMNPELAYSGYEKIWSDSSSSLKDKELAARQMATMSWLLYDSASKAFEILRDLEKLNYERTKGYLVWSRMLSEEGDYDESIRLAKMALKSAESEKSRYDSEMRLVKCVFEKNKSLAFQKQLTSEDIKNEEFYEAFEMIYRIMIEQPGDVLASDLYLGMALITDKKQQAYDGWLSFYRADAEGNVHTTLHEAQHYLLSGLVGKGNSSEKERVEQVILGLAESGFMEYATMVVNMNETKYMFDNSRISDIGNYYLFLQNVDELTINFYRETVIGEESKKNYRTSLINESKELWEKLYWEKKPRFNEDKFTEEMQTRFNMISKLMKANGHFGLSLGHVVLEEQRTIIQHQKEGNLRYTAIDHMVSNGYSSWFWDGDAEIGGWAPDEESILQVRSAYNAGPIQAWLSITDSVEVRRALLDIKEMSVADDSIASSTKIAFLPGLSRRVRFNSRIKILKDLEAEGLSGRELRIAFLNEYEKLILESSIFAHEGRHAIDKKYSGNLRGEQLEFRAKLSEIYFSERPFLSVGAVIVQNIGDGTSHGDSNFRVLTGIVGWMESHQEEIEALDTNRALLPQLDLLNEDQLRAAVLSFDPLVN